MNLGREWKCRVRAQTLCPSHHSWAPAVGHCLPFGHHSMMSHGVRPDGCSVVGCSPCHLFLWDPPAGAAQGMEHVGLQEHSCAVQGCRAVRCELGWSRLQAGPGLQHWGGEGGERRGWRVQSSSAVGISFQGNSSKVCIDTNESALCAQHCVLSATPSRAVTPRHTEPVLFCSSCPGTALSHSCSLRVTACSVGSRRLRACLPRGGAGKVLSVWVFPLSVLLEVCGFSLLQSQL